MLGPRDTGDGDPCRGRSLPNGRGVSIRDIVRIGAFFAQPRSVQYGVASSNRVSSRSVSHLVAET